MKWTTLLSGAVIAAGLFLFEATPVSAEADQSIGLWQKEVQVGINILQSSYSHNWNGGDKGSVVWTGNLEANLEKQFNERTNWRNTLKLVFGQSHKQERDGSGSLHWEKPDKTDDIIDFESLFRLTPESGWDPFVSFKFTSMFKDLSDTEGRSISFNPMTFKESVGIARPWVKDDDRLLMTRLGIALIQNSRSFFLNPSPDQTSQRENSTEIAAEMITEYQVGALDGRVDWKSKLTLTLPFAYSGKSVFEDGGFTSASPIPTDVADYTTSLDVDWENSFSSNITKVISVKLFVRWVYDKYDNTVKPVVENGVLTNHADVHSAIRKAGQFKQTLALGLGYTFN